jgi:hypothetical protein
MSSPELQAYDRARQDLMETIKSQKDNKKPFELACTLFEQLSDADIAELCARPKVKR